MLTLFHVIWGDRLMGRCDTIPGIGHVATKFFHLQFIPLIPLESYLVLQPGRASCPEIPIPLCKKSVLVAYSRAGFVIGGFICSLVGFLMLCNPRPHLTASLTLFAVGPIAALLFLASYFFRPFAHASYERARLIVKQANTAGTLQIAVEVAYGRLSAAEADLQCSKIPESENLVPKTTAQNGIPRSAIEILKKRYS
jgi:hypothetical protein